MFGDRYQEIAFTGTGPLPTELVQALDGCLLTDPELRRGWLHPETVDLTVETDPFADVFAAGAHQEAS